jgi:cytochrome c-type biogenesis protein CcmH/NrfG
MLDTKRLIAEVAARNGIRVDPDDPAFALVTLVQLVLEESSRQISDDVRASIAEFERSVQKVETRAGRILAERVKEAATEFNVHLQQQLEQSRPNTAVAATPIREARRRARSYRSIAIGAVAAIAVFMVGVWIGIHWSR